MDRKPSLVGGHIVGHVEALVDVVLGFFVDLGGLGLVFFNGGVVGAKIELKLLLEIGLVLIPFGLLQILLTEVLLHVLFHEHAEVREDLLMLTHRFDNGDAEFGSRLLRPR